MDYKKYKYFNSQKTSGTEKISENTPNVSGTVFSVLPISETEEEMIKDDFDDFINIGNIIIAQKMKKMRFSKIVMSAIFGISLFAGIFIFSKKRKSGHSVRS